MGRPGRVDPSGSRVDRVISCHSMSNYGLVLWCIRAGLAPHAVSLSGSPSTAWGGGGMPALTGCMLFSKRGFMHGSDRAESPCLFPRPALSDQITILLFFRICQELSGKKRGKNPLACHWVWVANGSASGSACFCRVWGGGSLDGVFDWVGWDRVPVPMILEWGLRLRWRGVCGRLFVLRGDWSTGAFRIPGHAPDGFMAGKRGLVTSDKENSLRFHVPLPGRYCSRGRLRRCRAVGAYCNTPLRATSSHPPSCIHRTRDLMNPPGGTQAGTNGSRKLDRSHF